MPFERTFFHSDWVDGEDLVQAESDNGFNVRFHQIEDDLDALGRYVNGALLDEKVISLVPDFTIPANEDPWNMTYTVARMKVGQILATGFLPLSLPNGVSLIELRLFGYVADGGSIVFMMLRSPNEYSPSLEEEQLIPWRLLDGEINLEDESFPILVGDEKDIVNNNLYNYRLYLFGSRSSDSELVEISGVTIRYTYAL
jgi:hypothetical protein